MINFEQQMAELIKNALAEDIGDGDHSTLASIPAEASGKAVLKIKEDGILAGMEVAEQVFRFMEPGIIFTPHMKDGEVMKYGDVAFEVSAKVHTILQCERLVLNCMQRMSGIASLTRRYVDQLAGYHTRLLDTRKTTPNFRLFEKKAVQIGGGMNHRFGLFDMIMLKDNHIDYCGGIEQAITKAFHYVSEIKPGLKIEVETRSLDDVKRVVANGRVDRIMLDNFTPDLIREALKIIGGRFETEASGGIDLENLKSFAETGVDFISSGSVIHQARSLDLSLKAVIT
jgi:nicotinate-nucleotide pyrophosphorylase (carboxylating)